MLIVRLDELQHLNEKTEQQEDDEVKFSFKKKFVAGALAAGLVMGAGGIAAAYFTATGSGSNTTTVGTMATWTVTVTNNVKHELYPYTTFTAALTNGAADSFAITVTNIGTGVQSYTTVTYTISISSAPGTCLATWFMTAPQTTLPTSATLTPGTSVTGRIYVWLHTSGTNQNGCQGATVTLTVMVS